MGTQARLAFVPDDPPEAPSSMQDRFELFHRDNPTVLDEIVKLARERRVAGWRRCGMKAIFERLRWDRGPVTEGDDFRLNNNFHAFYARLTVSAAPDLEGFFEMRRQRVEYVPATALGGR